MNPFDVPDTDPDDPEFIESLRERGLTDEQIEQAQQHLRYLRELTPEQREAQVQSMNDTSMGMSLTPRIASSADLLAIATLAEERDYNRQISEEGLDALDPEGFHILKPFMIHRHAALQEVDPHMRCLVYLKLSSMSIEEMEKIVGDDDESKIPQVWMDVPMEMFVQLSDSFNDEESHSRFQDEVWRVILSGS